MQWKLFPPVKIIPDYVTSFCRNMLAERNETDLYYRGTHPGSTNYKRRTSGVIDVTTIGVNKGIVDMVAQAQQVTHTAWNDICRSINSLDDPYASRAKEVRQNDEAVWELRTITELVFESLKRLESVIIFCGTRASCVNMCESLTESYLKFETGRVQQDESLENIRKGLQTERGNIVGHLSQESKGTTCPVLLRGIKVGIAYHTAALDVTERKEVEHAFVRGSLFVLCCTTTLAAGVNLPATRVIIRTPWIGREFLTCSRYLQMVGRAGRTGKAKSLKPPVTSSRDEVLQQKETLADSYILLAPKDLVGFCTLVDSHIEPVRSCLIDYPTYCSHIKCNEFSESLENSGIIRIVLGVLDIGKLVSLADLVQAYKLTLLYQVGAYTDYNDDNDTTTTATGEKKNKHTRTIRPLLEALQSLLRKGYVEVVRVPDISDNVIDIRLKDEESIDHHQSAFSDMTPWVQEDEMEREAPAGVEQIDQNDAGKDLIQAIQGALSTDQDIINIPNVKLKATQFALAAAAGCITLADAERFYNESTRLQQRICLETPLVFLFLTITAEMSKNISNTTYEDGSTTIMLMNKVFRNFESHPDVVTLKSLGLDEGTLSCWLLGRGKARRDERVNNLLTRVWTALFAKDFMESPERFAGICNKYGFDKSSAMELLSNLMSRANNLRNFCQALDTLWWYPPLARLVSAKLVDSCNEELRPLLFIRHVSLERAKALVKIGLKTVKDLSSANASQLTKEIKYLCFRDATEIIYDARLHLRQEAYLLAADSEEILLTLNVS